VSRRASWKCFSRALEVLDACTRDRFRGGSGATASPPCPGDPAAGGGAGRGSRAREWSGRSWSGVGGGVSGEDCCDVVGVVGLIMR